MWQYSTDESSLDNNGNIIDIPDDNNNSASFKCKQKMAGQTGSGGTKDVEIMVPSKYLSRLSRTLEMPLINCEISLQLKWTRKCIIVAGTANIQNPTFQINDTNLYVPVLNLSTQENTKILKGPESGFKRITNCYKYLAKITNQAQNSYLDYLIDPSFQGVKRLFVLAIKNVDGRESHKQYYLPTVEIEDYNIMTVERIFFDQPIKRELKTYDKIRNITTDQGDGYTAGCFYRLSLFQKILQVSCNRFKQTTKTRC